MSERTIIERFHITDCTRCGNECAESCHVYRFYRSYHPQHFARAFIEKGEAGIEGHRLLWACVTCRACTESCPYGVPFADFIRELRMGRSGYRSLHDGLVQVHMRAQADAKPEKAGVRDAERAGRLKRPDWADEKLEIGGTKELALFVGCLPFFETAFGESCGIRPTDSARAAVTILNAMDISPVLLRDERCCGRDLYDIGERESFAKLARHNSKIIRSSGAKTVLTICPECAYTLQATYAGTLGDLPYRVMHITQLIAENMERLDIVPGSERAAFHDPCYLCRYMGVENAPREIISAATGGETVEIRRSGKTAPCCGSGSWIDHGGHTRAAVNERLVEAHEAGADTLITACPKCAILFHEVNPACSWRQSPVAVRDLLVLLASRLKGNRKDRRGEGGGAG